MRASVLIERLRLHRRAARDFLDALVALGMLEPQWQSLLEHSRKRALPDRDKESYVGGLLEMANAGLYPFWGQFDDGAAPGVLADVCDLGLPRLTFVLPRAARVRLRAALGRPGA